ncbi:MAG: SulP family inorganic anion transporter, partial [Pseudomonadota bacterium]|nr:SulP family inorganic anion transporter [Pseudomonadota bacterium]
MTTTTITPQKTKRTFKSFFPILGWLPKYQGSWLRFDLIAALTVWALVVPEAMAYAGIAGMPPEYGLYAAPLALIGYAIFGTSRHLNVGPSSTVAALSFGVVVG